MRDVAVKWPVPWIVCFEFRVICLTRSHAYRIFHKPVLDGYGIPVACRYSELMTVNMHGMRIVTEIAEPYPNIFPWFYLERGYIREASSVYSKKVKIM